MSAPVEPRGNGAVAHHERTQRPTRALLARLADHLEGAAAAVRELGEELDIQLAVSGRQSDLDAMPTNTTTPGPGTPATSGPDLLTAEDLAVRLRVTSKTIRRWRSEGRLPEAIEIAGVLRWRRADVERFIQDGGS